MEGANLHALDTEGAKSTAHLAGCPIGEGDGQTAPRIMGTGLDPIGNAVGDGPGLARARTGQHDDRALDGLGYCPLLVIEARQDACCGVLHAATLLPMSDIAAAEKPIMYSTVWCGYCQRLKAQLGREGITFNEIDIEHDPEAAAFVESVNGGNQTVPTVVFADGTAMTNPTAKQVKEKLGL
jgi:mycoredoxin